VTTGRRGKGKRKKKILCAVYKDKCTLHHVMRKKKEGIIVIAELTTKARRKEIMETHGHGIVHTGARGKDNERWRSCEELLGRPGSGAKRSIVVTGIIHIKSPLTHT